MIGKAIQHPLVLSTLSRSDVPAMSRGGDAVTWLLGTLFVGSVPFDGRAHVHLARLEHFFKPWHAVLYGAFTARAVRLCSSGWSRRRGGVAWWRCPPVGYGPAGLGSSLTVSVSAPAIPLAGLEQIEPPGRACRLVNRSVRGVGRAPSAR
jgi:hypothetical protein